MNNEIDNVKKNDYLIHRLMYFFVLLIHHLIKLLKKKYLFYLKIKVFRNYIKLVESPMLCILYI